MFDIKINLFENINFPFFLKKEKINGCIEICFLKQDTTATLFTEKNYYNVTDSIAKILVQINNINKTNSIINFHEFTISKTKNIFFLHLPEKNIKVINKKCVSTSLQYSNPDIFDLIESDFGYLCTEKGTEIKLPIKIKFDNFKALIDNKLETLENELKDCEIYEPLNKDDKVKVMNINNCVHTYNFLYTIIKKNTLIDVSKYKRIYFDLKNPIDAQEVLDIYKKIKEFKEYLNDRYYKKN